MIETMVKEGKNVEQRKRFERLEKNKVDAVFHKTLKSRLVLSCTQGKGLEGTLERLKTSDEILSPITQYSPLINNSTAEVLVSTSATNVQRLYSEEGYLEAGSPQPKVQKGTSSLRGRSRCQSTYRLTDSSISRVLDLHHEAFSVAFSRSDNFANLLVIERSVKVTENAVYIEWFFVKDCNSKKFLEVIHSVHKLFDESIVTMGKREHSVDHRNIDAASKHDRVLAVKEDPNFNPTQDIKSIPTFASIPFKKARQEFDEEGSQSRSDLMFTRFLQLVHCERYHVDFGSPWLEFFRESSQEGEISSTKESVLAKDSDNAGGGISGCDSMSSCETQQSIENWWRTSTFLITVGNRKLALIHIPSPTVFQEHPSVTPSLTLVSVKEGGRRRLTTKSARFDRVESKRLESNDKTAIQGYPGYEILQKPLVNLDLGLDQLKLIFSVNHQAVSNKEFDWTWILVSRDLFEYSLSGAQVQRQICNGIKLNSPMLDSHTLNSPMHKGIKLWCPMRDGFKISIPMHDGLSLSGPMRDGLKMCHPKFDELNSVDMLAIVLCSIDIASVGTVPRKVVLLDKEDSKECISEIMSYGSDLRNKNDLKIEVSQLPLNSYPLPRAIASKMGGLACEYIEKVTSRQGGVDARKAGVWTGVRGGEDEDAERCAAKITRIRCEHCRRRRGARSGRGRGRRSLRDPADLMIRVSMRKTGVDVAQDPSIFRNVCSSYQSFENFAVRKEKSIQRVTVKRENCIANSPYAKCEPRFLFWYRSKVWQREVAVVNPLKRVKLVSYALRLKNESGQDQEK